MVYHGFFILLYWIEATLSKTYEKKEALCLSCTWKRRKFSIRCKDSIVVLTHIAWAAIVTSASMVSYDLQVKNVAYSSTLEPNNVLYLSDYQIIHSIFFVVWYRKVPTKSNWFTKWTWHKTANKERILVVIDVLLTFLLRVAIFNPPSQLYSLNLLIFVTM